MNLKPTATNIILRVAQNLKNKNFAVYKDNVEVLTQAQFVEGSIDDDVSLMEHPLESGAVIVDHEVFNPKKGSLSILIDDEDQSSLSELNKYYQSGTALTIKAKGEMFPNMVICAKPFRVSADHFNKTLYSLSFRAVQVADTQYVKMNTNQVKNSKDASTLKLGQKSPQELL